MARSTGVMTRTTNGIATSACAIGHQPRRAPEVERRVVERDEEPEPDGDRRDAEGQREHACRGPRRRVDASANAAQPPTTTAITRGRRGEAQRVGDRVHRGPRTACCPACTSPSAR